MPLGAHMSVQGGIHRAFERGECVGCKTIQIFTRNPNRWAARPLAVDEISQYGEKESETGIFPVIAHDSYLPNLGSPDDDLWKRSLQALYDEMIRCEQLGIPYLVMHPGAHMGSGEEEGLTRIATALSLLRAGVCDHPMVLLETTAGSGTVLGNSFEQLAQLVEQADGGERLGVCFDTCHAFAAGYELRTREAFDATFEVFDRIIGLDRLKAFHLNDSKKDLGSHVDRHEHIGKGLLGLEPFRMLLNDPRFQRHPMVLETPKGPDMREDIENLATLRGLIDQGST